MYLKIHHHISKACAMAALTLILPVLAYAGHTDNAKGGDHDGPRDHDTGKDRLDRHIPVVPEANAGWVLIPFFGAVLLYSWRARTKA
jgi:hypothetical protein